MKVIVIIATYNGKKWYKQCFDSLRQSNIPVQTVVIDNASSDGTSVFLKENYPELILIESDRNLGFGQANNLGMRYALKHGADYVFLLNQDAWIEPNTIEELINIHTENKEYGILSPMHLNSEKNEFARGLLDYVGNQRIIASDFFIDLYFSRLKRLYEIRNINAAAWLMSRNIIEVVGGFDPIFFHYGEDDNYIHRALFHGFRIGICPGIKVVHDNIREIKKDFNEHVSFLRLLLVEVTNINITFDKNKYTLFYIRKIVSKIIKLNFIQARHYASLLKFIYYNHTNIKKSRATNIRKATSWLY